MVKVKKEVKKKKVEKNPINTIKEIQEPEKVEVEVEEKVEKKEEVKPHKVKRIQIKERTFDAETGSQFSNWVAQKQFIVLNETEDTYTFGNEAKFKLGVVKKSDCVEV